MESPHAYYPRYVRLLVRLTLILLLGGILLASIDRYFAFKPLEAHTTEPSWRQVYDTYQLICDGGFPDQKVWVVRERNILEKQQGQPSSSQTQTDTVFAGWLHALASCPVSLLELPDQGKEVLEQFPNAESIPSSQSPVGIAELRPQDD